MNAYLIFMLILVIGFSVVQVPYGYSLNSNNSTSTYYEKNCRNDTCVVTTCNNAQTCHTALSENSTSNNTQLTDKGPFETQSQLTDKGPFDGKNMEFMNFWKNFKFQ
ncbi:hypothetical protein [Candidatus Nitrosocosmicus arcticus]|uniref:Uncharacterized protein n=1 Tax=Candidatus Nitrosocosmicus arcticus TaxID=2035267 RepID=A0A557SV64_9ARCH|nr:hypothetical protein [Candidatus Nitrosocosmicus arcticus]TVP40504.1 hypothetical protein NARC_70082 [Candidatus Nitrosocosmicus arcticus]